MCVFDYLRVSSLVFRDEILVPSEDLFESSVGDSEVYRPLGISCSSSFVGVYPTKIVTILIVSLQRIKILSN